MVKRFAKYGRKTQIALRVALILGIVVLVNIVSVRIFGRIDLTDQKVYTLTDASKRLAESFDDRVTVKAYFTEDLPSPYNNHRRAVLDLLNEYRAYAGDNLVVEFINPTGEKGEQEARDQKIPPVEVQVVNDDKLEIKRAYLGLVFLYEDKKETLPVVQNLSTLEYDISSALKRLTQTRRKTIGYTEGHGELPVDQWSTAAELLRKQYDLVPVTLSASQGVPDTISALMVIAPTQPFGDSVTTHFRNYTARGGSLAFFLNAVGGDLQTQIAQPVQHGLNNLLRSYGAVVNTDLVRDAQCATIGVVREQFGFRIQTQVPFPLLPMVSSFSRDNVMVKDLQNVVFYFVSSVDTVNAAARDLKTEFLVRSSDHAGRERDLFYIDPTRQYTEAEFSEQAIPLALLVEGAFPAADSLRQPAHPSRVIVFGDGDFMRNDLAQSRGNMTLFANCADYLADDAGLITIRSKNIVQPPLEKVSDGVRQTVKWGLMLVPPLLVIGYGLLRWRRRVNMRKILEARSA